MREVKTEIARGESESKHSAVVVSVMVSVVVSMMVSGQLSARVQGR